MEPITSWTVPDTVMSNASSNSSAAAPCLPVSVRPWVGREKFETIESVATAYSFGSRWTGSTLCVAHSLPQFLHGFGHSVLGCLAGATDPQPDFSVADSSHAPG